MSTVQPARPVPIQTAASSPGQPARPLDKSALILKFGAVGDVLMAIPAAYELFRQGYRIDWIVGTAALPVIECYSWINPIVIDEVSLLRGSTAARLKVLLGLWRLLAGRRYDLVATLYYDRRYRAVALPVRAARRVMLSATDRRYRLLPGRHHTDEFARILLNLPDEVRPERLAPVRPDRLPPSPLPRNADARPRVILAPAGARNLMADDALRRWPAEHYVELAKQLFAANVEVVLSGGPGDSWIQTLFAGLPLTDLIGTLTLPQTLALYDEADLVITHDTGPLHLAGVTRCDLLGLFGPTDPRGRLPSRPGATALWGGEHLACRPCYDGHTYAPCPRNDCLGEISSSFIFQLARATLRARSEGRQRGPRVLTWGTPRREQAGGLIDITTEDTP